ncbi:MAG: FlgD immunoglobulin-like domain containing protein [Candidatus Eisenbacteria bacterium]
MVAAIVLSLGAARPARAAIQVALAPALQSVAPGADFDVRVEIPSAGSPFNAFDVVVQYDPAVLTFLPTSPTSLQQGCLVTGGCSAACGSTFHLFSAAGDSLAITESLLCNGISLTGPGTAYTLRFRASNTPQVTTLSIRRKEFFAAGLLVTPVSSTNCQVGIGIPLDVTPGPAAAWRVQADPNPAFGRVRLTVSGDGVTAPEVDILDVSGRAIRHLAGGNGTARSFEWNGVTDSGTRASAGLYLVRVRSGAQMRLARFAWLP